jgi:hypothetical protein
MAEQRTDQCKAVRKANKKAHPISQVRLKQLF